MSLLSLVIGSGCAVGTDSGEGDIAPPPRTVMDEDLSGTGQFQAPPVKIRMKSDQGSFLAMFALRGAIGAYAGEMEHWFAPPVGFAPNALPSLEIEADSIVGDTQSSLEAYTAPLALVFSTPRVVRQDAWSREIVRVPEGTTARLFWTAHPDDAREVLGVLLISDRDGALVSSAWYRSKAPDETGRAFASTRFTQPLTLAVDRNGNGSTDPNDIRVGDWYSIEMRR